MGTAEPMDFEHIIKQMQEKETLELLIFLKNRQNEELFVLFSICCHIHPSHFKTNTFEAHGFKITTQTLEWHIF